MYSRAERTKQERKSKIEPPVHSQQQQKLVCGKVWLQSVIPSATLTATLQFHKSQANSLMAKLMSDCMRQSNSIVLIDTAWLVCATHPANIRNAQSGTSWSWTNVSTRHKDGDIMVIWIVITFGIQGSLPSKLFYFFTPSSSHFTAAAEWMWLWWNEERDRDEEKESIRTKYNTNSNFTQLSYLQKLSSVVSASSVMLSSEWVSSSSSRIIFTTTTWMELPIDGSL